MTAPHALFRPEAVAFRQRRGTWGDVVPLQPPSAKVVLSGIALAVALIAVSLVRIEYARKETVAGYLAPSTGVVKVYAARPGTVRAVHVVDGQVVAEGDPLLTVAVDQTAAGGANVDAAVLDTLERRRSLLEERIAGQARVEASERRRLQNQMEGIDVEAALLRSQLAAQDETVRLAAERVAAVTGLHARGNMSTAEFVRLRQAHLDQVRQLGALAQAFAARQSERAAAQIALEQLPFTTVERVQALRNEMLEAEQRIAEIEGRRAYIVRSPAAGRISTLQAAAGRAADPRQAQLSILPQDDVLHAELLVPTRAAGFVRPGQEVRVLYDAFPYQRFGTYRARVASVSQTVLLGADLAGPVAPQEPVYRVVATLERQDVATAAGGTAAPLQADMLLRADVVLDRRPLVAWLFDSLLRVRLSQ